MEKMPLFYTYEHSYYFRHLVYFIFNSAYFRSSSRYDLVSVTPLPTDRERASCTTKAIVSAVSRYPEREIAVILAEDESMCISLLWIKPFSVLIFHNYFVLLMWVFKKMFNSFPLESGQILRCDVIIDSLHSIEIVTTTRVLFLEDAPEAFEVVAKNDRGK